MVPQVLNAIMFLVQFNFALGDFLEVGTVQSVFFAGFPLIEVLVLIECPDEETPDVCQEGAKVVKPKQTAFGSRLR